MCRAEKLFFVALLVVSLVAGFLFMVGVPHFPGSFLSKNLGAAVLFRGQAGTRTEMIQSGQAARGFNANPLISRAACSC